MNSHVPKTSVFLPNIRSGWNVGAFFRTADSLGIDHVFLAGLSPYPPHKEISKTALDADMFVPWTYFENSLEALQKLKSDGIKLVAMELTNDAVEISDFKFDQFENVCLVMGNEVTGVSSEMLNECDEVVFIPMKGNKQSMNVSVAGSIGMWELMRRR